MPLVAMIPAWLDQLWQRTYDGSRGDALRVCVREAARLRLPESSWEPKMVRPRWLPRTPVYSRCTPLDPQFVERFDRIRGFRYWWGRGLTGFVRLAITWKVVRAGLYDEMLFYALETLLTHWDAEEIAYRHETCQLPFVYSAVVWNAFHGVHRTDGVHWRWPFV